MVPLGGTNHDGQGRRAGDGAWTVDWACTELAEQYGVHISPRDLRYVLRGLRGLRAVAEMPPGPAGGRGAKLYPTGDIQVLADFLIRRGWLQSEPPAAETQRDRKRGVGKQAERAARRMLPARHAGQAGCVNLA